YMERNVFRGGCFFAAASAEFDSRPGPVRDFVARLTRAWLEELENEARKAHALSQLHADIDPAQLAFEVHAFVQEANWAHQLLGDKLAFNRARQAIEQRLESAATASARKGLQDRAKAKNKRTLRRTG